MIEARRFRYAIAFLLFAASAAGQVLYQTGFEPPTFTLGPLNGQDTWVEPSNLIVVQNTLSNGGTRGVSLPATGIAGQVLAGRSISNYSIPTQGNLVRIRMDMFLSSSGTPSNWDAITVSGSQGLIRQLIVTNGNTARLGSLGGNVAVTRGVWNTYELDLDMVAQTLTAFVNGTFIASGPFVNSSGNIFNEVGFGLNSGAGTDTASFDNLSITTPNAPSVPVPTLSGVALAAMAVMLAVTAIFSMRRRVVV